MRRRHHRQAAFGLFAKQAEIGRRIADTEYAQPAGVFPARTNAAADKTPRHDAKVLAIEIAQVDDIHAGKIARIEALCFFASLRR